METQGQNITGDLNHLIALAEDGRHGYEEAAKDVKNSAIETLFRRFSTERAGYIQELKRHVAQLGDEPKESGGPIGALHRTWIDLKAALTSGDKDAIIKECITGEEYALKEYEDVIAKIKTDSPLKQMLVMQRNGIQAAVNSIKLHLDKK